MLTKLIFCSFLINTVFGEGQFVVLQTPESLSFSGNDVIDSRVITDVLTASLGFSVNQASKWKGVNIKHPFGFAKALVVVSVEGVSSLGDFEGLPTYPISPIEDEYTSWKTVEDNVRERIPNAGQDSLLRVDLGQENFPIREIKTNHLSVDEEDADFLEDFAELKAYIEKYDKDGLVQKPPVVNWFVLSSLHTLSDLKGPDSDATLEAKQMLHDSLIKLGNVVGKKTGDRALVCAIITDGSHTRHERAAYEGMNSTVPSNRATIYTEDYPVIFNIILWFSVAFIFSLIAVSYFIADMDPGRDSIIYRMTSNRMKKDS